MPAMRLAGVNEEILAQLLLVITLLDRALAVEDIGLSEVDEVKAPP